MPTECQRCGKIIAEETPRGICPVCCLLGLGFEEDQTSLTIPGVELGERLGSGSFGDVYEGVELHAAYRRVAVKVLRSDVQGSAQRARFLEEMQILALLNHPHLAALLGSGRTSSGVPYYLMELIEGQSLDQWASDKSLPEKLRLLREITEAVAYAHQQGIAHRDLKPANILITSKGSAKVIDFGIARAFSGPASWGRDATQVDQRIGTPQYMSPEQIAGQADVDLRTDIWSLGLLLYELVLGKPLLDPVIHSDSSWEENLKSLRTFTFPKLPDRELDWIARKACALDRRERYPTGQALLDDLVAKESGQAVSVGLSHRSYRWKKFISANRLAATLITSVALILLILASGGWWLSAKERNNRTSLADAFEREKEQHQKTLEAERQTRLASSDASLLLAIRAMDAADYAEARSFLSQALELSPKNSAARFATNYLNATLPEAISLETLKVDHSIIDARPHLDGGFLLLDQAGSVYRYHQRSAPTPTKLPFPAGEAPETDPANKLRVFSSKPGVLDFHDSESGQALLSPLVFGSGREKAIYSPQDQNVLVVGKGTTIQLWDSSHLRRGFRIHQPDLQTGWIVFIQKTSDILYLDEQHVVWKWSLGREPRKVARFPDNDPNPPSQWALGENHDRGIPGGFSTQISYLQSVIWRSSAILLARSRDNDNHLVGRKDGSLWVKSSGLFYDQITPKAEDLRAIAIDKTGNSVARVVGNQLELYNTPDETLQESWTLASPIRDLIILDSGLLLAAQENGQVTVWDKDRKDRPVKTITVAPSAPDGFHIRSVPGRDEFLSCLDNDVAMHRHSALTGESTGPDLRHEKGISWCCFAGDPDILYSIDQTTSGPGTLRIWSLRLGREIVPGIEHPDQIHWATILHQGTHIATTCADRSIRRWILEDKSEN